MKNGSRDLLVLSKSMDQNEDELQSEVDCLNQILIDAETVSNFCLVYEIIDANKIKIFNSRTAIQKMMLKQKQKPFVFVFNKN